MECEQQFSLSWNNFHGNVSRELSGLLGSTTLADVTLAVEGELLQAHRLVLAICSPYFKRMFQTNPHHHPIVVLRDVTYKAMRDLLQFMYHGEVSVKREDLTGFIATAELLQIKGLTNKDTDEDPNTPKQCVEEMNGTPPKSTDKMPNLVETSPTTEIKRRILNEKIQRLNQLKRTSEQFLHDFYQTERPDKRSKSTENVQYYDNAPISYNDKTSDENKSYEVSNMKTECDDNDIVVTDPALDLNKSFDECNPDSAARKEMIQTSNEDACGLGSLLTDLKSVANSKFLYRAPYFNEEFSSKEHMLMTIPQKMDGKKKYPQRSCRMCGKLGKRKDTRFMCSYCLIPFCKSPCFEVHARKMSGNFDSEYPLLQS